jgi:septal ring factor EnvC (AmiA/AmiB activator)
MEVIKKLFIFLITLTCLSLVAAPMPVKGKKTKNIKLIKRKIDTQKSKLNTINKELLSLEKRLGNSNSKYIRIYQRKNKIESAIYALRESLFEHQEKLQEVRSKSLQTFKKLIVSRMGKENDLTYLVTEKTLKNDLKAKIKYLNVHILENKKMTTKLGELGQRLEEYKTIENEILNLIKTLESNKRSKVNTYVSNKEFYDRLGKEYEVLKVVKKVKISSIKKNATNSVKIKFSPPIYEFTKINVKKGKGVTFGFDKETVVLAAQSGKIVYVGVLANYGKVVMIDHGADTRSVYFGSFVSNVKKGQVIKQGMPIGNTQLKSKFKNSLGKIYFEVRKKNKVIDTIGLIDSQMLASSKFSNEKKINNNKNL